MDEVSLKFNMSTGLTYDFIGKKGILIKTCKGNKTTFTALLAVLDDGTTLPPLLVFKSKFGIPKDIKKKYEKKILIYSNPSGWSNEFIILEWLKKIWLNLNIRENYVLFLIMDQFSAHLKESVKKRIKEENSEIQYIHTSREHGHFTTFGYPY